jgi:cell filamentation protein, protein adenylyltransferase
VPEDPYVYPGTDCLRNRLGIRDADELRVREGERTSVVLAWLERNPLPGHYDLEHLQAFHRRIFGDIYEWAGELRTVAIAKEQSLFAVPEHIEPYLSRVLSELAEERLLRGLPRHEFVDRLTHYYAELNAVHPFREGNGRTQRAFLGQLAHEAGYHIAWERLGGERNNRASAASLRGDNRPLQAMLDDLVEPLSPSQD